MSVFSKVTSFVTGDLFGTIAGLVKEYYPPDMTPQQRAELDQKVRETVSKDKKIILDSLADAEKTLNTRIAEQEGTASDLKQLPVIGRIVLFLRGVQRPLWGFFAMYLDYIWFTTSPGYTEQQQTALIVINILVLGFLFGERTIKNLSPLIIKVFGVKQ